MVTAENYLNNPDICRMMSGPIKNEKLDEIYNLIECLALYKTDCLKKKYEDLDIPNNAIFNWEEGEVIYKYAPDNEDEDIQARKDIFEFLFILTVEYENLIFLIYSQIEAILKERIKQKNEEKGYKEFKRQIPNRSDLMRLYEYNVQLGYSNFFAAVAGGDDFMDLLKGIMETFNRTLRKKRNIIAHELIRIPPKDNINEVLENGENVILPIVDTCNYCIDRINVLLFDFKLLLKSFDLLFGVDGEFM